MTTSRVKHDLLVISIFENFFTVCEVSGSDFVSAKLAKFRYLAEIEAMDNNH